MDYPNAIKDALRKMRDEGFQKWLAANKDRKDVSDMVATYVQVMRFHMRAFGQFPVLFEPLWQEYLKGVVG